MTTFGKFDNAELKTIQKAWNRIVFFKKSLSRRDFDVTLIELHGYLTFVTFISLESRTLLQLEEEVLFY